MKLTWLGHATWLIEAAGGRAILDPFLDDNPAASMKAAQVEVDTILLSHGHFDHMADAAAIANRTGATVVANYEIATWIAKTAGVKNVVGMNLGGSTSVSIGTLKMVPAWHSSQLPDGTYGGAPAGFILTSEGKRIYFACDTALFSDMQLFTHGGLDVAVLPIGDFYTMGIDDSVLAAKLLGARMVLPTHHGTWPPITVDTDEWGAAIHRDTSSKAIVLKPGEAIEI